jgi:hypothetical protein
MFMAGISMINKVAAHSLPRKQKNRHGVVHAFGKYKGMADIVLRAAACVALVAGLSALPAYAGGSKKPNAKEATIQKGMPNPAEAPKSTAAMFTISGPDYQITQLPEWIPVNAGDTIAKIELFLPFSAYEAWRVASINKTHIRIAPVFGVFRDAQGGYRPLVDIPYDVPVRFGTGFSLGLEMMACKDQNGTSFMTARFFPTYITEVQPISAGTAIKGTRIKVVGIFPKGIEIVDTSTHSMPLKLVWERTVRIGNDSMSTTICARNSPPRVRIVRPEALVPPRVPGSAGANGTGSANMRH